jgi:putative transposase
MFADFHFAGRAGKSEKKAGSADRRFCGPRLFLAIFVTVSYSIAVSKLRRPFLSDRYFFIAVRLLRRREKLTEPDFALLARAFNRARALHPFYLTAWVFLPDHWHCICAPLYPVTISLAMKSVKQSSMSAVNQRRDTAGELWQPRFFDRALRTVQEYNEKVEYIHLNPVRAGLVSRPEDWRWSSCNEYAGMRAEEQKRRCGLIVDRVRMPSDPRARI